VRLDRYLFFARLLKSRTLAQALIEGGNVRANGKRVAKPAEEIDVGSVISFALHSRVRVVRVLALPIRRGPASEAQTCYEEIGEASNPANVSQQGGGD
jgi:ribosome-associated heat shock protein Hsp15